MEEMCQQEREKHAQEISLLEENIKKGFASVCQNILSEAIFETCLNFLNVAQYIIFCAKSAYVNNYYRISKVK